MYIIYNLDVIHTHTGTVAAMVTVLKLTKGTTIKHPLKNTSMVVTVKSNILDICT